MITQGAFNQLFTPGSSKNWVYDPEHVLNLCRRYFGGLHGTLNVERDFDTGDYLVWNDGRALRLTQELLDDLGSTPTDADLWILSRE